MALQVSLGSQGLEGLISVPHGPGSGQHCPQEPGLSCQASPVGSPTQRGLFLPMKALRSEAPAQPPLRPLWSLSWALVPSGDPEPTQPTGLNVTPQTAHLCPPRLPIASRGCFRKLQGPRCSPRGGGEAGWEGDPKKPCLLEERGDMTTLSSKVEKVCHKMCSQRLVTLREMLVRYKEVSDQWFILEGKPKLNVSVPLPPLLAAPSWEPPRARGGAAGGERTPPCCSRFGVLCRPWAPDTMQRGGQIEGRGRPQWAGERARARGKAPL